MIVRIPHNFIQQHNENSFREYFINPENIMYVEVNKFVNQKWDTKKKEYTDEVTTTNSVNISMSAGYGPALKTLSDTELQEFILWWNKSMVICKIDGDKYK